MDPDLGERLQSFRKRHGLTQQELALASGGSGSLVRKIEQGERDGAGDSADRLMIAMTRTTSRYFPHIQ